MFWLRHVVVAAVLLFVGWKLASFRGLPNVLIIMSVLIVAYNFFTNQTTTGRRIYALGGNEKAAKLSGIKTSRLVFLTFVNMGVLAALAGMIVTARLNSATPKAGVGFELDVIAAVFIGGASMSGGVRQGGRRRGRRAHHGRDEQRHVDHGYRHRLPAGHQGPGAARRRHLRCLQQDQAGVRSCFSAS
ncbi:ABC transporter permease subunit [Micropruina sp.]|uniref:ABC transporter permease subunit n=1 Tax=Micropruina sp. TaxID=2737536 RepID=UPI0039E4D9A3